MDSPHFDTPLPAPETVPAPLPWSLTDTWLGLGLLVILVSATAGVVAAFKLAAHYEAFSVVFVELIYIVPALIVLALRHADFRLLGYRTFDAGSLRLGCSLVIGSYAITLVNNLIFMLFHQSLQADKIVQLLGKLSSPYVLFFTAVFLAPFVEETFFRGFLFAGFRQRYGFHRAALLSSAIFAAAHLQLAAFIPTFVLGYIFSYLYNRTNSIFPGMLLHFLVNAFGILTLLALTRSGLLIPR